MHKQGRATNVGVAVFVFGNLCILEFRDNKESLAVNPLHSPCSFVASSIVKGGDQPLQWRQSGSTKRCHTDPPMTRPPKKFCGTLVVGQLPIE